MDGKFRKQAEQLVKAIEKLANDKNNLDNFESYLAYHFDIWLERYANDVEGLVSEMTSFAEL